MFEDIINTPKKPEIIRIFTCNYNVQTQCPGYSADQMAVCKFLGLAVGFALVPKEDEESVG